MFTDFTTLATQLVMVALLVEAVTETIKGSFNNMSANVKTSLSMFLGVFFCVVSDISLFDVKSGVTSFYSGAVVAGILASRGANYVHDVIDTLKSFKK
jgi:fructose-specific phosphotransferase system IIC component